MMPTWDLQKAIYQELSSALSVPVYDSVEQGTAMPYVTFDYFDLTNRDMLNQRMDDVVMYFAVWSDYRGQREIMDILAAMDAALHEKRLTLDSGRIAQMRTLTMRTNREPDGLTYMGQYRLGVLIEH